MPLHTKLLLTVYGFAFGLGTNFLGTWFYPIRGISWIDLLLMMHFGLLLLIRSRKYRMHTQPSETATIGFLLLLLAAWLLFATLVNTVRYPLEFRDILAILRLMYFIALIMLVSRYVERHGYLQLVVGFCAGAALMFYQDFSTPSDGTMVKEGIQFLANPNVVGAQLGLAVYFCSLGVIAGRPRIFIPLAAGLAALTVTTFSKGAWLLAAISLAANFLALGLQERDGTQQRRFIWGYACVFATGLAAVVVVHGDTLLRLLEFKLASTADIGSLSTRQGLLLAGLFAGLENPAGLGYGNYFHVQWMYPELGLSGLGPDDNAHNLFGQIAAVGGVPALLILIGILGFAFHVLYKLLRDRLNGPRFVKLAFLGLSATTFVLYASVQLQLIAQPGFWFYCAILIGTLSRQIQPARPSIA